MNEMVFYDANVSHVNPGQVAQSGVPFPNRFCGMSPALEDGNFNEKILEPSPADLVQYSFLFDSESQDVVPKDYSCSNFNYQPDQSDASWDDGKLISTPEEDEATLWELMDKSQLRFLSFFDYGEIIRELHVFKLANPQMPIEGFLEFAEANGELLFSLGKKNFFITLNYEEFLSRHRPSGEFIIETAPSATSEVNLSKFELCNASYTPSEKATTFPPNDIDSEGVLLPWQAPLAGWGGEKVSEDIQLILDKEWEVGRFKHLKKARAIERKRPNNKIEWRPVTLASAMGVTSRGSPIVESLVGQLNMRAQRAWKRRSAEAIAREKKMSASVHVRQTEKCTRGTEGPFSENSQSRSASPTKEDSSQRELLKSLLGTDIPSWPFTEYSLVSAIALRTEQERSKQESLRLQTTQASCQLIQCAMEAGIPPHLIPSLISGKSEAVVNMEHEPGMQPPSRPPVVSQLMRPSGPTQYGSTQHGSTQHSFHPYGQQYGPTQRYPPLKQTKIGQPIVSQDPYRRNHRRAESDGVSYESKPRYAGVRGSMHSAVPPDEQHHPHQRTPSHHSHHSPFSEGSEYFVGASPKLQPSVTTARKGPGQHVIYPPPTEAYRPPQGKQDVSFMISTPSNPPK